MSASPQISVVTFVPGLDAEDATAAYWLHQVTVRLRREICWRWHLRRDATAAHDDALPRPDDPLIEALDLVRYADAKQRFFRSDVTARFLTQQLAGPPPSARHAHRGSFGWVVEKLCLSDAASFTLALAVSATVDGAVGPVIGACLDDAARTSPTLALAQKLWEDPAPVIDLADPGHALWSFALVQPASPSALSGVAIGWDTPLGAAPLIARQLLFPGSALPDALAPLEEHDLGPMDDDTTSLPDEFRAVVARLRESGPRGLRLVPVSGAPHAMHGLLVARVARDIGRPASRIDLNLAHLENPTHAHSLVALAWLVGRDLLVREGAAPKGDEHRTVQAFLSSLRALPVIIYVPVADSATVAALPKEFVLPQLTMPSLAHAERVAVWRAALGNGALGEQLRDGIDECARRFRYERETILAIARALRADSAPLSAERLFAACRAEVALDAGELAQRVVPRFRSEELVLPPLQQQQFDEIHHAMGALTEVHFRWGTGRAWNESGISVLFAGPPGTGKTMAAEVLASQLEMPMFRIDLSQVVNKYIGETEKNLKRLFDLADSADTVLFFDECDALFGRRTEVREAHDRYANVEISYLLERMERFKGLAILATNRRKDIDEAFLRRLRYTVEFPMPELRERRALWQRLIPEAVDASDVDVDFLARQFPLAGGHIRSIVLNACLQTANGRTGLGRPRLTMERVIVAVKREYDKLGRSVTLEQFGKHAPILERLVGA